MDAKEFFEKHYKDNIVLHDYQKQMIDRFLHAKENVINIYVVPRKHGQSVAMRHVQHIANIMSKTKL